MTKIYFIFDMSACPSKMYKKLVLLKRNVEIRKASFFINNDALEKCATNFYPTCNIVTCFIHRDNIAIINAAEKAL